jgi:hypothetical protein
MLTLHIFFRPIVWARLKDINCYFEFTLIRPKFIVNRQRFQFEALESEAEVAFNNLLSCYCQILVRN